MIFDNELSADIDVLNEDVPSELKSVMVEALKKRPLLEKYRFRDLPPIAKFKELVIKELVVRRPVLTVLAKVDKPKSVTGLKNNDVPKRVLVFIKPGILKLNELIEIVLREVD
jgi:hypothetical protein